MVIVHYYEMQCFEASFIAAAHAAGTHILDKLRILGGDKLRILGGAQPITSTHYLRLQSSGDETIR